MTAGTEPAARPLVARTVLDLRPAVDKFVSQTLLLAAGWHRYARDDAALEVATVGGRPRRGRRRDARGDRRRGVRDRARAQ